MKENNKELDNPIVFFRCKICKVIFETRKAVFAHKKAKHAFLSVINEVESGEMDTTTADLVKTLGRETKVKFHERKCQICNKLLPSPYKDYVGISKLLVSDGMAGKGMQKDSGTRSCYNCYIKSPRNSSQCK